MCMTGLVASKRHLASLFVGWMFWKVKESDCSGCFNHLGPAIAYLKFTPLTPFIEK